MNEESKAQHCGDTCGVVASMARTFKEYVPTEQRMASAIAAVQSGKMSQRGAATEFGVAQSALSVRLSKVIADDHPAKTQASAEVSVIAQRSPSGRNEHLRELRRLASAAGITQAGKSLARKAGVKQLYDALIEAGHDVPNELIPSSIKSKTNEQLKEERPVNDCVPGIAKRRDEAISDDNPIFNDELDIDAVRQHVCAEVQQSDRPADFKRAIELLAELDIICTNAWYRRQPEPWEHDDWAHVSSEIDALHSIVWQRATETADELLRKSSAVKVNATPVA